MSSLVRPVVVAATAVAAVLLMGPAPVSAQPAPSPEPTTQSPTEPTEPTEPTGERAVFTGQFVRDPDMVFRDGERVRVYTVAVERVYDDTEILTQRVTVAATQALESCGTQEGRDNGNGGIGGGGGGGGGGGNGGIGAQPALLTPLPAPTIDRQLRLFRGVPRDEGGYTVLSCGDVTIVDGEVAEAILAMFGEGEAPGTPDGDGESPFEDVGYLCPETSDAVAELDAASGCPALQEDGSVVRAAAPGLALLLVGGLGLLVARRRR